MSSIKWMQDLAGKFKFGKIASVHHEYNLVIHSKVQFMTFQRLQRRFMMT